MYYPSMLLEELRKNTKTLDGNIRFLGLDSNWDLLSFVLPSILYLFLHYFLVFLFFFISSLHSSFFFSFFLILCRSQELGCMLKQHDATLQLTHAWVMTQVFRELYHVQTLWGRWSIKVPPRTTMIYAINIKSACDWLKDCSELAPDWGRWRDVRLSGSWTELCCQVSVCNAKEEDEKEINKEGEENKENFGKLLSDEEEGKEK